jgi:hypothetical protein
MPQLFLFLLLFLIPTLFGFGQVTIDGQIVDAQTKEPLPYVNIGLVDQNVGTVSDDQGFFEFEVNPQEYGQAVLRFSMIGFETKEYPLNDYINQELFFISMAEETTALDEVMVSSKRTQFETKVLGNKTTSQMIYASFTTNLLGNEMGFIVRQRKRPMILKKFNFSIVENDFIPLRFRLNFYKIENGLPSSTLLKENILIETNVSSGVVTKDLSPYEIVIDEDFFVSIEWIEDLGPGNLFFSGGFFGSSLIAREVSQGTWRKVSAASVGMNVEVRY